MWIKLLQGNLQAHFCCGHVLVNMVRIDIDLGASELKHTAFVLLGGLLLSSVPCSCIELCYLYHMYVWLPSLLMVDVASSPYGTLQRPPLIDMSCVVTCLMQCVFLSARCSLCFVSVSSWISLQRPGIEATSW